MKRRALMKTAVAALVAACVLGAACSKSDKKSSAPKPSTATESGAPAIALATKASGVKIGLIVSSGGPGADVKDLAAGAYVAAFRLNGATDARDKVSLIVEDDNGTAEGATAAMAAMADQGVAGVVYASLGDHMKGAVAKAAELGMPVVMPYADDASLTDAGATSFITGPTVTQTAQEFATRVQDRSLGKVALVRQAGSYGDAGKAALAKEGLSFQSDTPFTPGGTFDGKGIAAGAPDAVIVWAEAEPAVAVADGLAAAGYGGELLLASRAAVPAFGQKLAGSLAAPVGDGVLSAGTWAGADTPGAAIDAFYVARDKAVSDGGVTADLGAADFRSHDAVLALVAAAGSNTDRGHALDGLRALSASDVKGIAGAPMDFSSNHALGDGNVALLAYSTLDDGSGRYPAVANAGGHWLAVAGTFDNPFGGQ
jgi:ABC-type branched-subunit amino acid transport system substrate-binding protein